MKTLVNENRNQLLLHKKFGPKTREVRVRQGFSLTQSKYQMRAHLKDRVCHLEIFFCSFLRMICSCQMSLKSLYLQNFGTTFWLQHFQKNKVGPKRAKLFYWFHKTYKKDTVLDGLPCVQIQIPSRKLSGFEITVNAPKGEAEKMIRSKGNSAFAAEMSSLHCLPGFLAYSCCLCHFAHLTSARNQ